MIQASFSKAVDIYKEDFGSWFVYGLVWAGMATVAGTFIPIVGGLATLPLALREASAAVRGGRSPQIGNMFSTDRLGEDFMTMLFYAGAQILGMLACCVGWPVAWLGFYHSAELAADGRVSPTGAMKLSMAWTKQRLGEVAGLALAVLAMHVVAGTIGLGIGSLFALPVGLLAWTVYWHQVRDQVYALAPSEGVEVAPETTPVAGQLGMQQPFDGTAEPMHVPPPVHDRHEQ